MESHSEGSEESYRVKAKGAKEICKRQMSQEELDKEILELKELLSKLMKLLEEDQRQGWVLKKTVKWLKLQQRL